MKVLILGSGAREHAMAWKLSRERDVSAVLCAPGNPGIAAVARCLPADLAKPPQLGTDDAHAWAVQLDVPQHAYAGLLATLAPNLSW